MIELVNVSKIYDGQSHPAVDNLSIKINEGEICVFVGPSGCGKSTTLRMINRLIAPSSGQIYVDGLAVEETCEDELRQGIGYVIQQIGLLPHKTVGDNIAMVPKLHGWKKDKILQRTNELLGLMGLDPEQDLKKYPSQLSGGQMQRVGVARAMAVDPKIMLMDEPFGAVDPIARAKLQDEFLRLQKTMKKTICFVTHDMDEAIKMGDRIAIFNQGNIVQYDTPENIYKTPANDFVKEFIGRGRIIKSLGLMKLRDLRGVTKKYMKEVSGPVFTADSTIQEILSMMLEEGREQIFAELDKGNYVTLSFKDIQKHLQNKDLGGGPIELG